MALSENTQRERLLSIAVDGIDSESWITCLTCAAVLVSMASDTANIEKGSGQMQKEGQAEKALLGGVEKLLNNPNFEKFLHLIETQKDKIRIAQEDQQQRNVKFGYWNLITRRILLFCALAVISILALCGILKDEALVGILGAFIGYLCGDKRGK